MIHLLFSWPLLLAIRFYWLLSNRTSRTCLFKISCSRAVYYATKSNGIFAGIRTFIFRYKNCRVNYTIIYNKEDIVGIVTKNKVYITIDELNNSIFNN
ncbi:MAG: membrane protein insertion efficiency factor YidD [Bacteroidia bacterium]